MSCRQNIILLLNTKLIMLHGTSVFLNANASQTRIRFTLAHELGHILIPWHIGTIIDNTRESQSNDIYWLLESEANRFASELLMPSDWIASIIEERLSPEKLTEHIMNKAGVSSQAATIRLIKALRPGYVFALLDANNQVVMSGRSDGTIAKQPEWYTEIEPSIIFPFCKNQYQFEMSGNLYYWWEFTNDIDYSSEPMNWREALNKIVDEICIPNDEKVKFKQRINGIIASANGYVRGEQRNVNALCSACLQRLYSKGDELELFRNHNLFDKFLFNRVKDLIDR